MRHMTYVFYVSFWQRATENRNSGLIQFKKYKVILKTQFNSALYLRFVSLFPLSDLCPAAPSGGGELLKHPDRDMDVLLEMLIFSRSDAPDLHEEVNIIWLWDSYIDDVQ